MGVTNELHPSFKGHGYKEMVEEWGCLGGLDTL